MVYDERFMKAVAKLFEEMPQDFEANYPTYAVVYTLGQLRDVPISVDKLVHETARLLGLSFRLYHDLEPQQGYEKAVREAEKTGYIERTREGYMILTSKSLEILLGIEEVKGLVNIARHGNIWT